MNSDASPGYFRKMAILLLRIIAFFFIISCVLTLVSMPFYDFGFPGPLSYWIRPMLSLLAGLLIWYFSERLARSLARGLDD